MRWVQAREDAIAGELRSTLQQLVSRMTSALHLMTWLTWDAMYRPERISIQTAAEYDVEIRRLLPEMMGTALTVAAIDPGTFRELRPIHSKMADLDVSISTALLRVDSNRADCIETLAAIGEDVQKLRREMTGIVSGLLDTRLAKRAQRMKSS